MDDRFVLVRSDTDEALSIVSGNYEVVQPKEVLEFYRELVSLYGYTLETAGALNGGRKVWALSKTGRSSRVGEDGKDKLAAYLLLATSCDKTLATTIAFTSIRVVCKNTLFFCNRRHQDWQTAAGKGAAQPTVPRGRGQTGTRAPRSCVGGIHVYRLKHDAPKDAEG